ncbi:MAG: site-specific DNA-methyltransferase [Bacteroidetes bacterium]|nr:site-specific DNA-methyltransferase [Bacteroidota bacterium]
MHGDSLQALKSYGNNHFKIAIVDPPYGIGIDGQKQSINNKNPKANRKAHDFKGWDNTIPPAEYFAELWRVSKNQIIWGANYFVEHINKPTKGWVVWYKGQEGLTMSDAELAFSSFDSATRVVKINRVELLKEGTIHPTQKPVKLYKWLLNEYAETGDKILDTHLGSGSSRIAAEKAGLHFVGFEIDEEYFNASIERFENHVKQPRLQLEVRELPEQKNLL